MVKCRICNADANGTDGYQCNHCNEVHCSEHRLPEAHDCAALATTSAESEWFGDAPQRSKVETDDRPHRSGVTTPEPMDLEKARTATASTRDIETEHSSPDLNPDGSLATPDTSPDQEDIDAAEAELESRSIFDRVHGEIALARRRVSKLRSPIGLLLGTTIVLVGFVNLAAGNGLIGSPLFDFYRPLVSLAYKGSLYATGVTQLVADVLFIIIGVFVYLIR